MDPATTAFSNRRMARKTGSCTMPIPKPEKAAATSVVHACRNLRGTPTEHPISVCRYRSLQTLKNHLENESEEQHFYFFIFVFHDSCRRTKAGWLQRARHEPGQPVPPLKCTNQVHQPGKFYRRTR